jgi:hypothetical protein
MLKKLLAKLRKNFNRCGYWLCWRLMDSTEVTGVNACIFDLGDVIELDIGNPEKPTTVRAVIIWIRGDQFYVRILGVINIKP